ncbi:MAG: flagellar motor protein MotB [Chlorobi bacterium]|nr:flagellar motor protein MotB [Chlorobiota bacterium]
MITGTLRGLRAAIAGALCGAILFSGCTSLSPALSTPPRNTSNGIVEIDRPEFQKKINTTGWLVILGTTAAGGAAGYAWNGLSVTGDNGAPRKLPGVSGAIAGVASGLIAYLLMHDSKVYPVPDDGARQWLAEYNNRLVYVSHVSSSAGVQRLTAVPASIEPTFTPKNSSDIQLFAQAFPNSRYTDSVIYRAIPKLAWTELPSLASTFPKSSAVADVKRAYVMQSLSVAEAAEAASRYPELRAEAEEQAILLVKNLDDIKTFSQAFPESRHVDSLLRVGASRMKRNEVADMIASFPNSTALPELKRQYLAQSATTEEVVEAGSRFPELKDDAEPKAASLATNSRSFRAYLSAYPKGGSAAAIRQKLEQQMLKPENLGRNINSQLSEVAPIISPDGKTLYYTRDHGQNVFGQSYQDIWYSTIDSVGDWLPARRMDAPLNNDDYSSFVCSATPDGNTLLLGGAFVVNRTVQGGVFLTHRTDKGWSYPEKVQIKDFYTNGRYLNYFMANDGKTILMSLERKEGLGENDLYVSFLQNDGTWSAPLSLGKTINTTGMEASPFLAADGATLYFSSNGHGGYGGNDIFVTRRLDNTWQKWSKPENLGAIINSPEWDAYYTIPASGDYAYFVSHKSSLGLGDIMRIGLPESARPKPVVLVSGHVLDAKTGRPVAAQIFYEILPEGKEIGIARSGPTTGDYKITLPAGSRYAFRAEAPGYIPVNDNIDVTNLKEYKELTRDLKLVPIEVGQTVRLNNIFFDFAKTALRDESFPELNRMVTTLQANPAMVIEIAGHTDNVGSDESNVALSQNRAAAVESYLESKGIARSRMSVHGYGKTKPLATNDTEDGRQQNRRVEFTIIKR